MAMNIRSVKEPASMVTVHDEDVLRVDYPAPGLVICRVRAAIEKAGAILAEFSWLATLEYSLADLHSYWMVAGVERVAASQGI
jgi:hypothetical protein